MGQHPDSSLGQHTGWNAASALLAQLVSLYLWAPDRWSWSASSSGIQCSSSGTWSPLLWAEKRRSLRSGDTRRRLHILGEGLEGTFPPHPLTQPGTSSTQQSPAPPSAAAGERGMFWEVTGVPARHWDTNKQTSKSQCSCSFPETPFHSPSKSGKGKVTTMYESNGKVRSRQLCLHC